MKSWRSRVAAGFAVAAAMVAIPLATAETAAADVVHGRYYSSAVACQTEGNVLAQQGKITSFECKKVSGKQMWQLVMWV